MVEVVLAVGLRLDEPELEALARLDDGAPVDARNPQSDVLERRAREASSASNSVSFLALGVVPDQREPVGAFDHVHVERFR